MAMSTWRTERRAPRSGEVEEVVGVSGVEVEVEVECS
jgi:hypothetical protein